MPPVQEAYECLAHVVQQVPAISNLLRARRTGCGALRVTTRPITSDDLNARTGRQPLGEAGGGSFAQQINRLVLLHVAQDGAVPHSPPDRPIVYSQHTRCTLERERRLPDASQQRIRTGRHAQALGEACSAFAAARKGNPSPGVSKSDCLARIPACDVRQTFGEDPATAPLGIAKEPAHFQQ